MTPAERHDVLMPSSTTLSYPSIQPPLSSSSKGERAGFDQEVVGENVTANHREKRTPPSRPPASATTTDTNDAPPTMVGTPHAVAVRANNAVQAEMDDFFRDSNDGYNSQVPEDADCRKDSMRSTAYNSAERNRFSEHFRDGSSSSGVNSSLGPGGGSGTGSRDIEDDEIDAFLNSEDSKKAEPTYVEIGHGACTGDRADSTIRRDNVKRRSLNGNHNCSPTPMMALGSLSSMGSNSDSESDIVRNVSS